LLLRAGKIFFAKIICAASVICATRVFCAAKNIVWKTKKMKKEKEKAWCAALTD
jgi:hypothetical protein